MLDGMNENYWKKKKQSRKLISSNKITISSAVVNKQARKKSLLLEQINIFISTFHFIFIFQPINILVCHFK